MLQKTVQSVSTHKQQRLIMGGGAMHILNLSLIVLKYNYKCAFRSCSLLCKFIDHVFDLMYELASRESDQYFPQWI